MKNTAKFKGGPIFLNSGGLGPDDYIIKPLKSGKWVRVIRRYGRHGTGDKEACRSDIEAFKIICQQMFQVDVGTCARTYDKRKDKIKTISTTEFIERYGDVPTYQIDHYGRIKGKIE